MYCCTSTVLFSNALPSNNSPFSADYFTKPVDVGMWYRKLSPDATKTPKKKCRDRRKPGGKSVEDSGGKLASQKEDATTQKEDATTQKVRIKSL